MNIVEYDEIRAKLDEVKDAANFLPDTSTDEGYNKSKRVSLDIGKLLTALEKKRKEKKEYFLNGGREVDSQAKSLKEELERYQEPHKTAYKQLDNEKKEREEKRKAKLLDRCAYMENLAMSLRDSSSDEIKTAFEQVESEQCLDFYEFTERALKAKNKACDQLAEMYDKALKSEMEAEELERLRKEAEERARIEREEQIKREAAAKAEAEKKAAEERERLAKEAEGRAKVEAAEAEKRAMEAEEQRKRDAEEAEKRRIEAERRAAEEARQAEIARQKADAERVKKEQEAREANKRHVGGIRKSAKEALMAQGLDEAMAKKVVMAINNGEIPNITINY